MTQPTSPLLLAVDGNSLVHRAFHASSGADLRHSDGRPLGAVRGVLTTLVGIAVRFRPAAVVVGFDDPSSSVRTAAYPQYKAGRPAHSPDIAAQVVTLAETLPALGVAVRVAPGREADDVLASAATQATAAGWRCLLATSDRDSWALVTDSVRVLRVGGPIAQAPVLGPAQIQELTSVTPAQYRDLAVLRGDPSDNLPGVPGFGPKTAARLLGALGTLDAALADLEAGGDLVRAAVGPSSAGKLADPAARTAIDRNRSIMALLDTEELHLALTRPTGPGRLALPDPAPVLGALECPALIPRWTHAFAAPSTPVPAVHPAPATDPGHTRAATPARAAVPAPRPAPTQEQLAPRPTLPRVLTPARPAMWPLTL